VIALKARKSLIQQHDQSDCGVACLATVIRYYSGDVSLESLRQITGASKEGTSLLGLYQAAEWLGFDVEGLEADNVENLRELNELSILHVLVEGRLPHYIVLFGFAKGLAIVGDPAKGIVQYSAKELESIWVSKALLKLAPNGNFKVSSPERNSKLTWLANSIRKDLPILSIALLICVITSVLGLTTAIFTQRLIDDILPAGNQKRLIIGVILVAVLLVSRSILSYIRGIFIIHQGKEYNTRTIERFYNDLMDAPKSFFDTRKTGDFIARLNDTNKIQAALSLFIGNFLIDALLILISTVFIFIYSWILGLMVIAFLGAYIILASRFNESILHAQRDVLTNYAIAESNYIDTIQGVATIKSTRGEEHFKKLNQRIYEVLQTKVFKLGKLQIDLLLSADVVGTIFISLVIAISAWFVLRGQFKTGELVAIATLAGNFIPSVTSLIAISIQIKQAKVALERMLEFANINSEYIHDNTCATTPEPLRMVAIQNLSFRFPGRDSILTDISLHGNRGELIAIMGESGCGKSTLLQILQKFYQPETGEIVINDVSLATIGTAAWRERLGVVPQDIKIFNGSVLYNVTLSENEHEYQKVMEFCIRSGLDSYFQALPQGYNTMLGEEGINISGGQKQIVALVRALFRKPQLLLLDEATSAMDSKTEEHIMKLLYDLKHEMIIIFVTHRMKIAHAADRIYMLQNGEALARSMNE